MKTGQEDITVDNLIAMLSGDGEVRGSEKTAFSRADVADASSSQLLNKISSEMDADEILKQAAHAKLSGAIISEAILEKLSANFGPTVAKTAADAATRAVHEKIASMLPQVIAEVVPHVVRATLEKIAIGTSSVISGNLSSAKPNDGPANALQLEHDRVGKGGKGRVESYLFTDSTEGASVSGGSSPEGGAGTKPEAWEPVGKMSAAKSKVASFLQSAEKQKLAYLQKHVGQPYAVFAEATKHAEAYIQEQRVKAAEFLKHAELEQDLARYQELEQKAASGMLAPEEKQELEMLRNKLMAAAGAGGGGAPGGGAPADGGGAPGGGPPGGGGGAPGSMGSFGDGTVPGEDKTAAVKALLSKYGLGLGQAA